MAATFQGFQVSEPQAAGDRRPALVAALRQQIRGLETAGRCAGETVISTGCGELDGLLPRGGMPAGAIHEWLSPARGCGAELLSLLAARSACAAGGALVVIDPGRRFYPPAAAAWGINLENVIVLRARAGNELNWAIDQALRCPAVGAVWGSVEWISERWQRRFQLSAEASGVTGCLVRPARVLGQPGWFDTRWLTGGIPGGIPEAAEKTGVTGKEEKNEARSLFDRRIALRLVRMRWGVAPVGRPLAVRIDFNVGTVHLVHQPAADSARQQPSQLATTLAAPRPRRQRRAV